ncbi:hypothetical protein NIES21_47340 [Anabaenopsis circularis NIES-21]|uniref:Uncharacterized protein n=1 Tax=Anabaenopsis circularis NIES-21 TaxID=1085406 RepID=A0A1Z4GN13_9CYAN|nr:hypothetical protein NIES21_47340 [Anabaenopsis circularis NIES-21]
MSFDLNLNKWNEYNEQRKKSSLKSVSTHQIEEAISKALEELLDCPYEVKIELIQFKNRGYDEAEVKISTKQGHTKGNNESEISESLEVKEKAKSVNFLNLRNQEVEFTNWFNAAKEKNIVTASTYDREIQEIIVVLPDGSSLTYSRMKELYPIESLQE